MGWGWNPITDIGEAASDATGFIGRDVVGKIPGGPRVASWLNVPYTMLISRPLTTFENLINENVYQNEQTNSTPSPLPWGHGGGPMGLFSAHNWHEAWNNSAHVSPGQGLALAFNNTFHQHNMVDPYNEASRDQFFQGNSEAAVGSGVIDAGIRMLDPANIATKAVANKAAELKNVPVKGNVTPDAVMARPDVQNFVKSLPGKGFTALANDKRLVASPMRYKAAAILSAAKDPAQAAAIYRIGLGDVSQYDKLLDDRDVAAQALDRLQAASPDIAGLTPSLAAMRVASILEPLDLDLKSGVADLNPDELIQVETKGGQVITAHAQEVLKGALKQLDAVKEVAGQMTQRTRAGGVANFLSDRRAELSIANARDGSPFSSSVYDPHTVMTTIAEHVADPLTRVYQSLHEPRATKLVDFTRDDSTNVVRSVLNTFSALTPELKDSMLQRYSAADKAGRQQVFQNIENRAVKETAMKYGLDAEHARTIYAESVARRGIALQAVKSRAYGSITAAGVDQGVVHSANGQVVADAYLQNQLARGAMPALDGRHLDLALSRMNDSGFSSVVHHMGDAGHRVMLDLLEKSYGLWKPLVLITGHRAYNHVGDDALRTWSKIGALASVQNATEGTANFLRNRISSITKGQQLRSLQGAYDQQVNDLRATYRASATKYNSQQGLIASGVKLDPANQVTVDDLKNAKNAYDAKKLQGPPNILAKHRVGTGTFHVPGVRAPISDLFGGPDAEYMRKIFSSDTMFNELFQSEADGHFNSLNTLADHDVIGPRDGVKVHANAILRYVKNQLAPDPVASQLLKGASENQVRDWMLTTGDGRSFMRQMHIGDPADHIEFVHDMINQYLPSGESKARALAGQYTAKDIERDWPAASQRPTVNGNLALLNHVGSPSKGYIRAVTDKLIKLTGTVPDDILVRHPLASTLYKANFVDRANSIIVQRGADHLLESHELEMIRTGALNDARNTMKNLLYDTSRFTSAGSTLRFISPFFNAWHNAMTSWAPLIASNPQLVLRGLQAKDALWNSPLAINSETGQRANSHTPLGSLAFVMHLPGPLARAMGMGDMNFIPIAAQTLISPTYADSIGNPGFGPIVAVPVNHLVKEDPSLISNPFLQSVLGGRITTNDLQSAIPSSVTQLTDMGGLTDITGSSADNVASRASLKWTLYQEQYYDYLNGKRSTPPQWSDVSKQASWMAAIDGVVNRIMPLGFKPQGNHRLLIDEYNQMIQADPKNAQQNFYDKYGSTGFMFTQSLSHNVAGIPATAGAVSSYKKYEGLIKQYPELAAVVVGPEGDGSFNDLAYQWEKANGLRTYLTPEQAASQEKVNLGWTQYNQIMANLNAQVQQRGLTSINQSGAQDLRAVKTLYVNSTGDQTSQYYNPDFYAAYGGFNQNQYDNRIGALEKVAQDQTLLGNPARSDIGSLHVYFQMRDQARAYLKGRASTSITASANKDVADWFDYSVAQLIQSDTKFSALYERYLLHDSLKQP